jgi:hypothetical protein
MYLIAATDKNTGKEIKRCAGPGCSAHNHGFAMTLTDMPATDTRLAVVAP